MNQNIALYVKNYFLSVAVQRQQGNAISAWMDASHLYGNHIEDTAFVLRENQFRTIVDDAALGTRQSASSPSLKAIMFFLEIKQIHRI